jgi:hypothetical protein
MKHPTHSRRQSRFQHLDCTEVIYLSELATPLCPQMRVGRQVVDLATAADRLFHSPAIADIAMHQLNLVQREMSNPSFRPFQDTDGLSAIQQEAHEVAADKAGTAGYENRF